MDTKEYISSGIIELYVLGLASEEEVSILECVRKNNAEVEQAIREAQSTMEALASAQAIAPPEHLRAAIWAKLSEEPLQQSAPDDGHLPVSGEPIPIVTGNADTSSNVAGLPQPRRMTNWAIAAGLALAGSVAANIYLFNSQQDTQATLQSVRHESDSTRTALESLNGRWALLQDADVKTIALSGVEQHPGLKAVVFWNPKTADVHLAINNLPEVPSGKQYQLWAMVDGVPVDAGVFPLNASEGISMMKRIPDAQAFAITLEDEGGKPVPTLTELYVIGNI